MDSGLLLKKNVLTPVRFLRCNQHDDNGFEQSYLDFVMLPPPAVMLPAFVALPAVMLPAFVALPAAPPAVVFVGPFVIVGCAIAALTV